MFQKFEENKKAKFFAKFYKCQFDYNIIAILR